MTPAQKKIFAALTVVIALSRLLAVAHSFFDWDEALFALGVRDFDVTQHHPHPPGYPLFIAAAKIFHAAGLAEFRALQIVVLLGAMAIFPALFFLARELGFDFATAAGGAAIYAFLPNVSVYGGTAFSDVPATALLFAACALLLWRTGTPACPDSPRDRQESLSSTSAYLLGAALLGIAAGFRSPNLLLGAVPALLATWHRARARDWRAIAAAIVLGAAIVLAAYLAAALSSGGIDAYLDAIRQQREYVRQIDSFRNPTRPPLGEVAKTFFLWPIAHRQQMTGLAVLAIVGLLAGLVQRRAAPLVTLAMFAPFAIAAWLGLDMQAAARYAIPYMAAHALLAADALRLLARGKARVHAALCFVVAGVFAGWAWPALRLQRGVDSPPAAAFAWVLARAGKSAAIYTHTDLVPHGTLMIADARNTFWERPEELSLIPAESWIMHGRRVEGARNFSWPRKNPLWKILRRRLFETAVEHRVSPLAFGAGWYGDEGTFRWMARSGEAALPPLRGNGKLRVQLLVPVQTLGFAPSIEVWWNGALVERFAGALPRIEKEWTLASRADARNELRITTSEVVNPAARGISGDARDLGLRMDLLSWTPRR